MKHTTMRLPYETKALEPIMSEETINYHFGKHYHAYLENSRKLSEENDFKNSSLDDIIKHSDGALYNNAAQTYNHEMFFSQLSPDKSKCEPKGVVLDAINLSFNSFDEMKKLITTKSVSLFGSGWVWLSLDGDRLVITSGSNAYCPLFEDMKPLMCIDVWEHAYYLDYRNKRADYVEKIWSIINWEVVEDRYVKAYKEKQENI